LKIQKPKTESWRTTMKHRLVVRFLSYLLLLAVSTIPVAAQNRVIVRDSLGQSALQLTCVLLNCRVIETIDGTLGQVFLVTVPVNLSLTTFLGQLVGQVGIVDAEPDLLLHVAQSQTAPASLSDHTPINYFGTTVWQGYATQPAVQIINLQAAQSTYAVTGAGIVAVIDTGVDPTHPVLQNVLLSGRDFTRNQQGGSETGDVNQSTMAVIDGGYIAQLNQSTMAVIDQQAQPTLSQSQYAAFGHGTMTSGIVHLVAPTAQIMPLKVFHADGTGSLSDVLRGIYYATQNNANVLSMSFDFTSSSKELEKAVNYAAGQGVVSVASAGNDGQAVVVYPAGLSNVMGIASTSNSDTLSSFSNYGQPPVWVGAPGEGIVTTYPAGTYAAGWGTSFSAPFVSGTVALLLQVNNSLNQQSAAQAISNAVFISPSVGNGRLDVKQAVAAWCKVLGQC
jgi:subtilisin family serine protease